MKRFLTFLLLILGFACGAQTYTEWYIQTTGDNRNSGHTSDDAATFTATAGLWTNNTGFCVFYKADLNPATGGVTNGAWASVFPDGSEATAFVGIITNVSDATDTIWITDVNSSSGTPPATDEAGATSIYVGGAWKGPGQFSWTVTTNTFPTALIAGSLTNGPAIMPCINVKSGTTYSVTNAMTIAGVGPYRISGYTTTVRDGGRPVIDGGTAVAGYVLLTVSGANGWIDSIEFSNNGNNGTTHGVSSSAMNVFTRCVFHNFRANGLYMTGSGFVDECEFYACNAGLSAGWGGFFGNSSMGVIRNSISHDNLGSTGCEGIAAIGGWSIINCIAYNNGGDGFRLDSSAAPLQVLNCSSYSNGMAGISITAGTIRYFDIQNCAIVNNRGIGITNTQASYRHFGKIYNCAFGTGTMTNDCGDIASGITGFIVTNSISQYAADTTPWTDPDRGNFRISLAAAKATGRLSYLQSTVNSPTNTVGFPDIGAAQSGPVTTGYTFSN